MHESASFGGGGGGERLSERNGVYYGTLQREKIGHTAAAMIKKRKNFGLSTETRMNDNQRKGEKKHTHKKGPVRARAKVQETVRRSPLRLSLSVVCMFLCVFILIDMYAKLRQLKTCTKRKESEREEEEGRQ